MAVLAGEPLPLGLALLGQNGHVDELEGAHLVVQLARPGAHRRLIDYMNDVSFLRRAANREMVEL